MPKIGLKAPSKEAIDANIAIASYVAMWTAKVLRKPKP